MRSDFRLEGLEDRLLRSEELLEVLDGGLLSSKSVSVNRDASLETDDRSEDDSEDLGSEDFASRTF